MFSLMAGCSGSAQTGRQNENTDAEAGSAGTLENGIGISSEISIEDAYYYNLLANDAGDIFAFTDNFSGESSKDAPVIAWRSSDRATHGRKRCIGRRHYRMALNFTQES